MLYASDVLTFTVSYKQGGVMKSEDFKSFASAAGHASALDGMIRMIGLNASNLDGSSQVSSPLYIYSKDNTRRIGNPFYVKELLRLGVK